MKKTISLLLILSITPVLLLGCTSDKADSEKTSAPVEEKLSEKEINPNLPTMSSAQIDSEMSTLSDSIEKFLKEKSDSSKLKPTKIPSGYGSLYQDIIFSSLKDVKGANNGSFHINPVKEKDHYILFMLGFEYNEKDNASLPTLEKLFKLGFPEESTVKTIAQYSGELTNSSPKKFPYKKGELVISKTLKENGNTKITIGYKYAINIVDK